MTLQLNTMLGIDNEDKDPDIPYVSYEIIAYLRQQFGLTYLLAKEMNCSEPMRLGYIKGVQDVFDCLENCIARQERGKEEDP